MRLNFELPLYIYLSNSMPITQYGAHKSQMRVYVLCVCVLVINAFSPDLAQKEIVSMRALADCVALPPRADISWL